MDYKAINKAVGNLDLFLLDQILKGRFESKISILDAGCGEGRNIKYFVNNSHDVTGIDNNEDALQLAQLVFREKANFTLSDIENYEPAENFDAVLCINVLHHAKSQENFIDIWQHLGHLLRPEGILFVRTLITKDGKDFIKDSDGNLLVSINKLNALAQDNALEWVEPVKIENWGSKNLGVIVLQRKL